MKPIIKKTASIPVIWILPLLTALIGGWLLYQSGLDAGIEISIVFEDAEGVKVGKTKIVYKGINIGIVKDMHLSDDMQRVEVIAEINHSAKPGLRGGASFWLVQPNVSLTGISGLDTLVSGNYIRMQPGRGKYQRRFMALSKPPLLHDDSPGLHINITAKQLGSIDRGSLVYYREIPVGEVRDYQLQEDLSGVTIKLHIREAYAHLVKTGSRFWNASGLSVKADLTSISIRTESFAALISGGIAFHTPEMETAESAENGQTFQMYPDFDAAQAGIPGTIYFTSAKGLKEGGTEIKFAGLKVGIIKKLAYLADSKKIRAQVVFDPGAAEILREDSKFWLVKPRISLSGVSGLETLIQGNYIDVQVGKGKAAREFHALNEPPLILADTEGLHLRLTTHELHSIARGSPVLFKKIPVGHVAGYQLEKNGTHIVIDIYISQDYRQLVNASSRFWNASGVQLDVGTTGLSFRSGSLSTMVSGAIEFITPEQKNKPAKNGQGYLLYSDYATATEHGYLVRNKKAEGLMVKVFTDDLGSLTYGSKVYYQKIPVGEISHYALYSENSAIVLTVLIYKRYQHLLKKQSRFWRNSGIRIDAGLSGVKISTASLNAILNGGLSFSTPEEKGLSSAEMHDSFSLYTDRQSALQDEFPIRIAFTLAAGIEAGTLIKYRGITVGKVKQVKLSKDNQGIVVEGVLLGSARDFARRGTKFWLVGAKIGLFKTKDLDTLLRGKYIQLEPGTGLVASDFIGLPASPRIKNGLQIVLKASRLGSIKPGDPVYFRQMPVGVVTGYALANSATHVLIDILIEVRYVRLVRENSKFWNASGLKMDFGLFSGAKISAESFETVLTGGIAFATPEIPSSRVLQSGTRFDLHQQVEEEWLSWAPVIAVD
jgi:paraquat-inducible protein B